MPANVTANVAEDAAPARMRVLDLFSGVGGFSAALQAVATTVAYCEVNPACHAVLRANMEAGRLDRAPIFADVTKLTAADLSDAAPQLITAGFPCQDISAAGAGKGLDGARSGLFFQIPRLVQEVPSIRHVLLENSPNIKKLGLPRVLEELKRVGLTHIAYGYFSACDVGALHRRCRWVCLASKAPEELPLFTAAQLCSSLQGGWGAATEPVPRVVPKAEGLAPTYLKRRCGLLGNAVVPQFIAFTYDRMLRALLRRDPAEPHRQTGGQRAQREIILHSSQDDQAQSETARVVKCATLQPNSISIEQVDNDGKVLDRKVRWNTPLHNVFSWYQTPNPGLRSLRTLGNCIFYERNTPGELAATVSTRGQHYNINPEFVEWLMGYPVGWTAGYTVEHDRPAQRQPSASPQLAQ